MPLSAFPAFGLPANLARVPVKYIRQDDRLRTGGDLGGVLGYRVSVCLGIQGGHVIGGGLAGIPNPVTIRQSFRVWFFGWTFGGVLV
jgi:hypothetical protein